MNVVASRAVQLNSSFLLLGNADIASVVANIDNVALVVGGVFVEVAVLLLLHSIGNISVKIYCDLHY